MEAALEAFVDDTKFEESNFPGARFFSQGSLLTASVRLEWGTQAFSGSPPSSGMITVSAGGGGGGGDLPRDSKALFPCFFLHLNETTGEGNLSTRVPLSICW